ncbi:hypothetical protein MIB92_03315 [Aestuariirhabdus sp. Z084]|uniref:hypothetical protein n=1 Tax=Aestuariirhabdus haliotis TaxID=2918751 RepID=UPI00201B390A|nr:hypothetical protein [Aestuariirhabdus haliotis]MCL6414669.1 hypothetical protein [Aestuariirhabdus haliotis]MCL6418601.1 hypothetical protein [Aestuariirhabdus haliotis]
MAISHTLRAIVEAASYYPSADNSQPLQFGISENAISIGCSEKRCSRESYFDCDSHAVAFSMGCAVESLLLVAKNLDTPCLVEPLQSGFLCTFPEIEGVDVGDETFTPVKMRHTNRGPYRKDALSDSLPEQLLDESEGAVSVSYYRTGMSTGLIQLIVKAASLRFRSPDLVKFLADSLRDGSDEVAQGDGLDIETLCLPPGGKGILSLSTSSRWLPSLNKLGFHRLLAAFEGMMLKQSAGLVVISGGTLVNDAVQAGQLSQRIWVMLNQAGCAVHPYYVVTDQLMRKRKGMVSSDLKSEVDVLEEAVKDVVGSESLHMVFRVGFPKRDVVRSRRLPLEEVYSKS